MANSYRWDVRHLRLAQLFQGRARVVSSGTVYWARNIVLNFQATERGCRRFCDKNPNRSRVYVVAHPKCRLPLSMAVLTSTQWTVVAVVHPLMDPF